MDVAVGHRAPRRREGHLGRALVGLADAQQDDVVAGAPAGIGAVEHLHHPERLHAARPGREAPLIGEAGHVRTLRRRRGPASARGQTLRVATAEVHHVGSEAELAVQVFDEQDLIVGPDFARHLADVARLVVSLTILGVTVLAARFSPRSVRSTSLDFVRLVLNLPVWLQDVLVGTAQLIALLGPIVVVCSGCGDSAACSPRPSSPP